MFKKYLTKITVNLENIFRLEKTFLRKSKKTSQLLFCFFFLNEKTCFIEMRTKDSWMCRKCEKRKEDEEFAKIDYD